MMKLLQETLVQAGIMLFKTPNSSFIFDLRRRSIKLYTIFRAIFRPAALVVEGCFLRCVTATPLPKPACSACPRGFICIIFLERVVERRRQCKDILRIGLHN